MRMDWIKMETGVQLFIWCETNEHITFLFNKYITCILFLENDKFKPFIAIIVKQQNDLKFRLTKIIQKTSFVFQK